MFVCVYACPTLNLSVIIVTASNVYRLPHDLCSAKPSHDIKFFIKKRNYSLAEL